MGYIRNEFGSSDTGNALDQVFLLGDRLGTNRKRIERAKAKGIADRFILPVAQIPLSENLHPDDSFPAARISRITPATVAGSASICDPIGLIRTKSTSTHSDFAAARKASSEWQEQPCARIMPFSFASESASMADR